MKFTVENYRDLVDLLETNPTWRAEMRRLVLTDEILEMPTTMAGLAEDQRHIDQSLKGLARSHQELAEAQKRTEQRVEELAEAQKRTEQRVEELAEAQKRTEQRVEELVEAQKRTEMRVEELAEAQKRTEQRLDELSVEVKGLAVTVRNLATSHGKLTDRVGQMVGEITELRYREHVPGYFGRWLRRARPVLNEDLWDLLEDRLPVDDMHDVMLLDLLVRGRFPKSIRADEADAYLAIEVSSVVDEGDVARARRRANHLRQIGLAVIPIAAGEDITEGAQMEARAGHVVLLIAGQATLWDDALAAWVP